MTPRLLTIQTTRPEQTVVNPESEAVLKLHSPARPEGETETVLKAGSGRLTAPVIYYFVTRGWTTIRSESNFAANKYHGWHGNQLS